MRVRYLGLVLVLLTLIVAASRPVVFAQGDPSFVTTFELNSSTDGKLPDVATDGANVFIASNADREVARLWSKADTAGVSPIPVTMGAAEGQPDFSTASVFTMADGTIHYAWINQLERRIYLRSQAPGGGFGPQLVVTANEPFPIEMRVAAMEDGVFVFWREADGPIKYRRSPDGMNWNVPSLPVFSATALPLISVAAGPGRRLAVGSTQAVFQNAENVHPFVSLWNPDTQSFITERIPLPTDQNYAVPSVALKPDGGYLTAFRNNEDSPNVHGVYISERGPLNGSGWTPPPRLTRAKVGTASASVDSQGNVHLHWIAAPGGTVEIFYAPRRTGSNDFLGIFQGDGANPEGNALFNLDTASNLRDRSYSHTVAERFTGNGLRIQYYLFALPVTLPPPTPTPTAIPTPTPVPPPPPSANQLILADGAATTNQDALLARLTDVTNTPDRIRWSWNQPPLDSDPFVLFDPANPTFAVAVPAADGNCTPLTLFTQLRRGDTVQVGSNQTTIRLDRSVQAVLDVIAPGSLDPRYTKTPNLTVVVDSITECSGLSSGSVSGSLVGADIILPDNPPALFTQQITLTDTPGTKTLVFTGTDRINNTASTTRTFILDQIPPLLTGADPETATTLVPDPVSTVLLRLDVRGLDASDVGGSLGGLAVQASVTPATNGVTTTLEANATIIGRELILPLSQFRVTTNLDGTLNLFGTLDLARFFPSTDLVPGVYQFQIGVVDGAGNRSDRLSDLSFSETLTRIGFGLHLPVVRR